MENFYDHGWNAYVDGQGLNVPAWWGAFRDGWKDARLCEHLDEKKPEKMD